MILTLVIIGITCVVSWIAFKDGKLMQRLLLWPPAIEKKHEYWCLLSYGLVHADFQHLLFNMITLFFFGRAMEWLYARHLGPLGFLWFYLGGLLVSILPTYIQNRRNANYHSHGGLRAASGTRLRGLGRIPSLTARVPCGLMNLLPGSGRSLSADSLMRFVRKNGRAIHCAERSIVTPLRPLTSRIAGCATAAGRSESPAVPSAP